MQNFLLLAAKIALPPNQYDKRAYWLGCIGIRNDGTRVYSRNGAVYSTSTFSYKLIPDSHAEGRILRKLDTESIIYIARVSRKDHSLAMSKPCGMCRTRIRAKGVKKVYYTINQNCYGVWNVYKNLYKICKFNVNCLPLYFY